MNKHLLMAFTAISLLGGCSMSPDYAPPKVKVSELYLNAATEGVSQEALAYQAWWRQFNDPQLNALVAKAQQQNISLQIASERVRAARAYQAAVSSLKVPTISVGAGYLDMRISENDPLMGSAVGGIDLPAGLGGGNLKLMNRDPNSTTVGATIAWEADLFGRIASLTQAAEIRAEQAQLYRANLTTLMTAEVIDNYLQYRGTQERMAIARQNIAEQAEVLALVESLERNGYGSLLDVANAKAALAASEAMLPMLSSAEQAHLHRLAILLGENLNETSGRLSTAVLPAMTELIPTGVPSELLTRRLDIAIAEREMAAKNQELGAAIAAKYPSFFLTGAPGLSADHIDDLFSSDSLTWALGAGVSWNVFDGGRTQAMVEIQEAGFKTAALSYQQAVNNAINEVETVLKHYGNNQQYHRFIAKAEAQSEVAVQKATSLYRAGLENHLSVLTAQNVKNNMQDAEVLARLQTASSVVSLYKALGGDWTLANTAD
ncbi:efflux transporter outer membrane subunit [Shewanella mangrovisoli]|uniref:efflux transporter outer membrane subunit n=1 Tax=Shewanella mangrovisoli TaxID=2864211 RepID=UPI0035B7124D